MNHIFGIACVISIEILEYVKTRTEYEKELAELLQISRKKLKNIEEILLQQLKRDRL
jgi:hypothetical protein